MKALRILILTLVLTIVYACAINPVTGKKELMLMSEQEEIALGNQSDPQIVASFGLYEDDRLQKFIDRKGQEMAEISHRPHLNYEFKILDSPVINAFAVPGGYVYFTRGILAHFNNEAEFAGVLGHEIGHVAARHSAKQYSASMLAQLGLIAGMVISEDFRQFGGLAQQGLGLLFLKFSRDHESESDRLGVEYSTKVGYDSHNMANFFETLQRMRITAGAQPIPSFLSTHPDPADREQKVNALSDEWQQKVSSTNFKTNRNTYLEMINGLIYGADPRQGYVHENTFYHPELLFQFPIPKTWETNNMPTQVQMTPPDGQAAIILQLSQKKNLKEAAQAEVEKHKLQVSAYEPIRLNGLDAYRMISDLPNEQDPASSLRIQSYLISHRDYIYVLHGLAVQNSFNSWVGQFNYTMEQFRNLDDPERINVKPERLQVEKVRKTGSFENALRAYGVDNDRMEEIAILNSMELGSRVQQGDYIKIIQ